MLEKIGTRTERFVRSFMPDPFVLALLFTLFAFGLALWVTPTRPHQMLTHWYAGFWELLSFSMQMVLIVATGEAIAETDLIRKLMRRFCSIPKSPEVAIFALSLLSIILGWLHWGFGLVAASLTARELGKTLSARKIDVHYPILGTAAYMSTLLWHAGTTGLAPLLINTPGHFLFDKIGQIPLTETVFLPVNLVACSVLALIVPILITRLSPKRGIKTIEHFDVDLGRHRITITEEKPKTFAEKLEKSYLINAVVGLLGAIFLFQYFAREGLNLNYNIINFLFLMLGILLHKNPVGYAKAVARSVRNASGIVLQFPIYGGIMGIVSGSGLGLEIAGLFSRLADSHTLPLFAYLASVVTKLFVPSGGGEWAVEGPVMLEAAKQLGSPVGLTTMGIAYGNMVGNLFQPFWALPLLGIMGLKARDIMGYGLVLFLFAFPILAIALLAS